MKQMNELHVAKMMKRMNELHITKTMKQMNELHVAKTMEQMGYLHRLRKRLNNLARNRVYSKSAEKSI
ncbi:hypothetical protein LQZ18_13195 [Lachnospiraceae bacterium ZAX-1]